MDEKQAQSIDIQIGTNLKNDDLCTIFMCSPQGGMRRAHRTNSLVLISNHINAIYDDRWSDDGKILYYTGMGQTGDQSLNGNQNKTLFESQSNDISVHLFEVFDDQVYTYSGLVELTEEPYQETQLDRLGNNRKVFVFPLKLKGQNKPFIEQKLLTGLFEKKKKKAKRLPNTDLTKIVNQNKNRKPGSRKVVSSQFNRDPWVVEYTLRRSNGYCELCEYPAPFKKQNGDPFLEVHHIAWLANGGSDSIDNAAALCPNCHRKMHALNLDKDVEKLKIKAKNPLE